MESLGNLARQLRLFAEQGPPLKSCAGCMVPDEMSGQFRNSLARNLLEGNTTDTAPPKEDLRCATY